MNGFEMMIKPDEEDVDAAEVLVDGTIGGFPYRFLLDTGAARSSVTYDDYTCTFDCIETRDSSGNFASSRLESIRVPRIELGPICKQDMLVDRAEAHPRTRANLIGMDVLKDFCCHFLFEEKRVVIQDKPASGWPLQELLLDKQFHPYLTLWFGEIEAAAVWDTGAGITLADMGFIKKHPALFQEVGHSQGTDATGTTMQTPVFLMASPIIGTYAFSPHNVVGVDLSRLNARAEIHRDLVLGYSTLRQANWWFDFPGRRWAISKQVSD
ncbi:MAG TPA: retropepsin-like aspartic protease [Ktedonobacteraceae bacterium]|nr:retropepsin-like aspartic protease [Ktedonobacteraceae bacterium]